MWTLQLRQAETALREGRLDEAFDLVIQPQVRSHCRGQSVATDLLQQFKRRIAEHVTSNRYEAALRDCDRAVKLGGNQADLVELRAGVLEAMTVEREGQLQRQRIRHAAREQIANGNLSLGYELCQQLPDATKPSDDLSAEIHWKQQSADKAIARAEAALENDALEEAVTAICEAQAIAAHRPAVCEIAHRTALGLVEQARGELKAGQLGLAESRLRLSERIAHRDLALSQLKEIVDRLREASVRIQQTKFAAAREQLQIVRRLLPGADWIDDTIRLAQQTQQACEELNGSPLSLLSHVPLSSQTPPSKTARVSPMMPHIASDPPSSHLLVQIDGAGRSLAIRKDTVRIGPRLRRATLDLAVQAADSLPDIEIARLDDDYFLRTAEPILVNGQPTTSRLLTDGDQIVAGARCSIKFSLPCAANHSALLQFSGVRLNPTDVRQVILMDDAFLIGPDSQSHLRVRQLKRRFVMLCRKDEFIVQPVAPSPSRSNEARTLTLGEPITLDGVTLLIQQFDG